MPASELVETGAAALLFATNFLFGGRMHPFARRSTAAA